MRKILYILFFVGTGIVSGCTKAHPDTPDVPDPVGPSLRINSCMTIEDENANENLLSPIGLYVTTEENQPYNGDSYRNYATLTHGQWLINAPIYIIGKGLVFAYYPYNASDQLPSLSVDMSTQTDLLCQKVPLTIDSGSEGIAIELSHMLSQIIVTVENEEVESISLTSPATGVFNLFTGDFSDLQDDEVTVHSDHLLVIPHSADTDMTICLKNGERYLYSLSGTTYIGGESYTYSFKLNKYREKLEITSVTVKDWISGFIHQDYLR